MVMACYYTLRTPSCWLTFCFFFWMIFGGWQQCETQKDKRALRRKRLLSVTIRCAAGNVDCTRRIQKNDGCADAFFFWCALVVVEDEDKDDNLLDDDNDDDHDAAL
jgi:hypothetical protein